MGRMCAREFTTGILHPHSIEQAFCSSRRNPRGEHAGFLTLSHGSTNPVNKLAQLLIVHHCLISIYNPTARSVLKAHPSTDTLCQRANPRENHTINTANHQPAGQSGCNSAGVPRMVKQPRPTHTADTPPVYYPVAGNPARDSGR